ncbi:Uma2 family endonuclease [Oscillatoria sp. FACHB-1406]|uniref:Uma2 family endonuclease n=1 Tax=Oscillatoria sp. FACHB-1406 TaxID=2692846 RepID=UPI0016885B1C|nr:Uma2 family endonuclease [Oscillatoria sp. FACHB-1406]MBD2577106.1 Uma2 family endonuclease [Oscillatoria sp. FACHB-1406]
MTLSLDREIIYPDSDGQPMADNTLQYRWIVLIKENLELLFAENPEVFVAGDLLWYAVEGSPKIRLAPDVMVAFGRPKGDRGSYQQWKEGNIAPQVVFEILSPGNRLKEMVKKFHFYEQYGVEEYYIYDPDDNELTGLLREEDKLNVIEEMDGFTSPRLGIRFALTPETLEIYRPDGRKFLTMLELEQRVEQATQRAEQEAQRAEQATQRAEQEAQRAEQATQRAERLAAQLRALGIDPDSES